VRRSRDGEVGPTNIAHQREVALPALLSEKGDVGIP